MALGFCENLASIPFLHISLALFAQVLKLKLLMSLEIFLHSNGVLALRISFCAALSPNSFAFICCIICSEL